MVRLTLTAECASASTREEALAQLDAFREAVRPSTEYGIVLTTPAALWVGEHHHRHGMDLFAFAEEPSFEQLERAVVAAGSSYEPSEDEWLDIHGPLPVRTP